MDSNPVLKVIEGSLQGQVFEVTPEGLVIGRGEECAVRLADPGVSREHARVFLHNAGVWVQDMGSRNGVFVKGQRLARPKQISPGTELSVGDHRFCLELSEAAAGDEKATAGPPAPSEESAPGDAYEMEPTVRESAPASKLPLIFGVVGAVAVLAVIASLLMAE